MEAFGHDLARADRAPDGVEGDVDGIHGVGGGMSGKRAEGDPARSYNQRSLPVPASTISLLFILCGGSFRRGRSESRGPRFGIRVSLGRIRHRSDSQRFAEPIAPLTNQSRPWAAQSPRSSHFLPLRPCPPASALLPCLQSVLQAESIPRHLPSPFYPPKQSLSVLSSLRPLLPASPAHS